jgi:glycosyltransferase involved in cell wall biosynthesis
MALFFDQAWFDKALAQMGRDRHALGQALGLDDEAMAEIWKDQRELSVSDVAIIAAFLNQPASEIANRAGVSTPVPSSPASERQKLAELENAAARLRAKLNGPQKRLIFLITEDWYFMSHRVPLALDALARGFQVTLAARFSQGRESLSAQNIDLLELPWRRGLPNWGDVHTLFLLTRFYRRQRPLLVHHVALKSALLGTLAARLAGVEQIICAIAGLGYMFTEQTLRARMLRLVFSILAKALLVHPRVSLLFQNADDRDRLCRLIGRDPMTCEIVPGAGIEVRDYPDCPAVVRDEVVVALVARMLQIKGVDLAVAAVRLARARGAKVRLQLVGPVDQTNPSGLSKADLEAWAQDPGIDWLGHQSDIPAIWRQADIALLPSRGGEGLPKALLEAAACGRPLIGTDVAGIRDLVIDGRTGLLVPPNDVEALAQAMVQLAGDVDLRARMGASARAHVAAGFSARRVVEQIGALHDRLWAKINFQQ